MSVRHPLARAIHPFPLVLFRQVVLAEWFLSLHNGSAAEWSGPIPVGRRPRRAKQARWMGGATLLQVPNDVSNGCAGTPAKPMLRRPE